MRKSGFILLLVLAAFIAPVGAQGDTPCTLPTRLQLFGDGIVTLTDVLLRVRQYAGTSAPQIGELQRGDTFEIMEGPLCVDGIQWWTIETPDGLYGAIAEGADGEYFVAPVIIDPTATAVLATPVMPAAPTLPPFPAVDTAPMPRSAFVQWQWEHSEDSFLESPDPYTITTPEIYAGDMPALPVRLDEVAFVPDANLNVAQLALLSQNGFVVVPAGLEQMERAYNREDWPAGRGYAYFVTTDSMLHSFYLVFENLLIFLEQGSLYAEVTNAVTRSYRAAEAQMREAEGTPLEDAARAAAVYYGVALQLLVSPIGAGESVTDARVEAAINQAIDPSLEAEIMLAVQSARNVEGRLPIVALNGYVEDFSQYRPRGHYAGDPMLERYFRAMMWLSRITFPVKDAAPTQQALLILRALESDPEAMESWRKLDDALGFLIGPVDNVSTTEYAALASEVFGEGLPLDALADATLLAEFQREVNTLPGPAISTIIVPEETEAEELEDLGRGFRWLGQRFTLDAAALQRLMDPGVEDRMLPSALDVAAVMGSDVAYALALDAGAADYAQYPDVVRELRESTAAMPDEMWMNDIYSGWLWILHPYLARDPQRYPPLMQTEAWLRRDVHTALSSYTQLKHATILYTAQPTGRGGGGGMPPLTYGYVEPNPLAFARLAIMAQTLRLGLVQRGLIQHSDMLMNDEVPVAAMALSAFDRTLGSIAEVSAALARMAAQELRGEPLSENDHYFIQYSYGGFLNGIRTSVQDWQAPPPDPVALVTDIANSPMTNEVLQQAVGNVDFIYVVIPTPEGLRLAVGASYSYYEFVGDIDARMTNEEWREQLAGNNAPPRPAWVSAFFAEN
jgi:hypothetical protein